MNTDTPLPPDEPAGQNPPDGAIIDYWLQPPTRAPVTLEILDAAGAVVRRYSSDDPRRAADGRGQRARRTGSGRTQPLSATRRACTASCGTCTTRRRRGSRVSYPDRRDARATRRASRRGPWALPGTLHGRADGERQVRTTQPLAVRMDPRVKTPAAALAASSSRCRSRCTTRSPGCMRRLAPQRPTRPTGGGSGATDPMRRLHADLLLAYEALQEVDVAPTAAVRRTVEDLLKQVDAAVAIDVCRLQATGVRL